MFKKEKQYRARVVTYVPKVVEDKEEEKSVRVFDIKLEIPDPTGQGIDLPCKLQDDTVVALKWMKQSGTVTVEFQKPGTDEIVTAAGSTVTVNNILLGGDGWVMPVRVRAKMTSDLAQYLYRHFGDEVAVKIYNPQGSFDFKGDDSQPTLQDRKVRPIDGKMAAAGKDNDDDDEGTDIDAEESGEAGPEGSVGPEVGPGDTPTVAEGAPGTGSQSAATAKELHDPFDTAQGLHDAAVKAQEEREKAAKIFGDAWEKLEQVGSPIAKEAMTWLAMIQRDTLRPEAVRKQNKKVHAAVKTLAGCVRATDDLARLNIRPLLAAIDVASDEGEAGPEDGASGRTLQDAAVAEQAEREKSAKIYNDAWEKLKGVKADGAKTAMIHLAHIAWDAKRPETVRESAEAVHQAVRRMAEMIMEAPDIRQVDFPGWLDAIDAASDELPTPVSEGMMKVAREVVDDISKMEGVESVKFSAPGHGTVTIPGGAGKKGKGKKEAKKRLRDYAAKKGK